MFALFFPTAVENNQLCLLTNAVFLELCTVRTTTDVV